MYVGNLSYDVKYRDMIEFMRGGGWGRFSGLVAFLVVVIVVFVGCVVHRVVVRFGIGPLEVRGFGDGDGVRARGQMASSVTPQRTQHPDVPWRSRVWAWSIEWGELQFPFSGF